MHHRCFVKVANSTTTGDRPRISFDEIRERDKTSLDITRLKDQSLTDLDNLPDPGVLASEIIENMGAGTSSSGALWPICKCGVLTTHD